MNKVLDAFRRQYTLGFNPSNPGAPGTYHKLSVKLNNPSRCPDCRLIMRSGYYTGTSAPRAAASETTAKDIGQQTDQLITDKIIQIAGTWRPENKEPGFGAIGKPGDPSISPYYTKWAAFFKSIAFTNNMFINDISFKVLIVENKNPDDELKAALLINSSGVGFSSYDGKYGYRLQIGVGFMDKRKKEIQGFQRTVAEGALSENEYRNVLRNGLPIDVKIPKKFKKHVFQIVVFDEKSNKVGAVLDELN
jgi:hypothetical protein